MSVYKLDDVKEEKLNPLLSRKIIAGEKVMLAWLHLAKGCVVPLHNHVHEQISYIVRGALKFTFPNEKREIAARAGDVVVIPSNLAHSAEALEDTVDIDCFTPLREDWLSGKDSYLRK